MIRRCMRLYYHQLYLSQGAESHVIVRCFADEPPFFLPRPPFFHMPKEFDLIPH